MPPPPQKLHRWGHSGWAQKHYHPTHTRTHTQPCRQAEGWSALWQRLGVGLPWRLGRLRSPARQAAGFACRPRSRGASRGCRAWPAGERLLTASQPLRLFPARGALPPPLLWVLDLRYLWREETARPLRKPFRRSQANLKEWMKEKQETDGAGESRRALIYKCHRPK